MSNPKTIITYLIDGNPQGIKTVELSNWIGKAISIPRAKLKDAKTRKECSQPALYFLFGKDEEENNMAYIGEAENLISRLANHDSNKDFWDTIIAFVSKDNNLTKADVKFLESTAINKAKEINRYSLENAVTPVLNNLPEYQESVMIEFLENINILISSMGYPILKEIEYSRIRKDDLYYLSSRGSNAKGSYTEDGFLVLKGSIGKKDIIGYQKKLGHFEDRRNKLIENNIIEYNDNGDLIFLENYTFKTPTAACNIVSGGNLNGWIERKDENGKTLDENERKDLIK